MFNLKENKTGYKANHLSKVIRYIQNPDKTEQMKLIDSVNCFPETALEQMMHTKRFFGKEDGRQGYHFVISFKPGEASLEQAERILREFVHEYLEPKYETMWAIHTDHEHLHGHIVFNSVSFVDGIKYHYNNGDFEKFILPIVNRLCNRENLSTVEMNPAKPMHENYRDYMDRKMNHEGPEALLMADLDQAIRKADSFEAFLEILKSMGYETKVGKYLSIRPSGRERFKRTYHFGKAYEIPEIKKRILREGPQAGQAERRAPILKLYKGNLRSRQTLTKFQRRAFARMYRSGKYRRGNGGSYYQYKEEIMKFKKLKEEYDFLIKNKIHSWEDLQDAQIEYFVTEHLILIGREEMRKVKGDYYLLGHILEERKISGKIDGPYRDRSDGTVGDTGMTEIEIKKFLTTYKRRMDEGKAELARIRKNIKIITRIQASAYCQEKINNAINHEKNNTSEKRASEGKESMQRGNNGEVRKTEPKH